MPNYLLAIDCSSPWLSIALQTGEQLYFHQEEGSRQHSQHILPVIQQLCAQANIGITEINQVIAGNGPGSFIGVRLAHAVAQALCFADQKTLTAVSSLQIIAQSAYLLTRANTILVAQDARKQEVYACLFKLEDGVMQATCTEMLISPEQLQQFYVDHATDDLQLIGTGWQAYAEALTLQHHLIQMNDCELAKGALALATSAQQSSKHTEPNYVRNHVADLPKK